MSLTDNDCESVMGWLAAALKDLAPSYGYKPRPHKIPQRMFLDMIEKYKVKGAASWKCLIKKLSQPLVLTLPAGFCRGRCWLWSSRGRLGRA